MRATIGGVMIALTACGGGGGGDDGDAADIDAADVIDGASDAQEDIDAGIDAAPPPPRRRALAAIAGRTAIRVYVDSGATFRKVFDLTDPLGLGTGITWTDY